MILDKPVEKIWMDVKDVAAALSLSRTTIWRMVKAGYLPEPMKVCGTMARWKASDIREAANRIAEGQVEERRAA